MKAASATKIKNVWTKYAIRIRRINRIGVYVFSEAVLGPVYPRLIMAISTGLYSGFYTNGYLT